MSKITLTINVRSRRRLSSNGYSSLSDLRAFERGANNGAAHIYDIQVFADINIFQTSWKYGYNSDTLI